MIQNSVLKWTWGVHFPKFSYTCGRELKHGRVKVGGPWARLNLVLSDRPSGISCTCHEHVWCWPATRLWLSNVEHGTRVVDVHHTSDVSPQNWQQKLAELSEHFKPDTKSKSPECNGLVSRISSKPAPLNTTTATSRLALLNSAVSDSVTAVRFPEAFEWTVRSLSSTNLNHRTRKESKMINYISINKLYSVIGRTILIQCARTPLLFLGLVSSIIRRANTSWTYRANL